MSLVAAKVTHIPRMVLSELPGPLHGCRQDAIDGLRLIGDRIVQAGADTVVTANWGNDLKVEIPETGVSLGELYRSLRNQSLPLAGTAGKF